VRGVWDALPNHKERIDKMCHDGYDEDRIDYRPLPEKLPTNSKFPPKREIKHSVPYETEEEYLMDYCRRLSKDFEKCEHCEFRFQCYTRQPEGRQVVIREPFSLSDELVRRKGV
jgi:hypothetical protein